MKSRVAIVISCLLVMVFIHGCGSRPYIGYAGNTLPMDAVAVIEPEIGIKIHTVNGKVVDIRNETGGDSGTTSQFSLSSRYHSAVLLPGQQRLGVIPQYRTAVKTVVQLQMSAIAGHKYLVRHKNVNRDDTSDAVYEIWVEDLATRQVVSNRAISQNPFRPVEKHKLSTSHQ